MNPGLFLNFLSHQAKLDRREFLDVVGKAGIAGAIATFGLLNKPANATGARRRPAAAASSPTTSSTTRIRPT